MRAVLPASRRIDLRQVRALVGDSSVELASEQTLAGAYPEFELGAVPPVGGPGPDPVLIDEHLAREPWIVFEAERTSSRSAWLRRISSRSRARVADICQD